MLSLHGDSSERTKTKFQKLCHEYGIPSGILGNIEDISKAIGKHNKAVIGIKEENIIYVNFELSDYFDIKTSKELDAYIKSKMVNKNIRRLLK